MNSKPSEHPGRTSARRCGIWQRPLRRAASLALALLLGLALWTFGAPRGAPDAAQSAGAWGDEALQAEPGAAAAVADWLPLAPANACGLGASSCFKCHNGKRAALPTADPVKGPWHLQHSKVNNSCVGCHHGNPRVMKEDVAHNKLVAKPRDDTAGSCAGCHTGDLDKVKNAYAQGGK